MIGLAATLLEKLAGPWLKILVVPLMAVGLITAAHQVIKARAETRAAHDRALLSQGRKECLAEVQLQSVQAQLIIARQMLAATRLQAQDDSKLAREVGDKNAGLEKRIAELEQSAAGDNPSCLSDGMRQRLWGTQGSGTGGPATGAGKGGGNR